MNKLQDVDCFYAQAEVLRQPHLKDRPVGITQKFLVVTCNYVARQLGVPKMVPIQEAKRRCPDLVLINGEDLTPYRAASKTIMKVLGRFGTVERLGLDEAAVDISKEVSERSRLQLPLSSFSGYVITSTNDTLVTIESYAPPTSGIEDRKGDCSLMVGTHIAAEIRTAVEKETGFRCSCGISCNKMLAKLVASIHKPDKQTCVLWSAVPTFLKPLPVRKIPGVGNKIDSSLKEMGVSTIRDMQTLNSEHLCSKFGTRIGTFLFNACRGVDHSLVLDKGPLKSLSVEDSFRACSNLKQIEEILQGLAPDLVARIDEDRAETGRRPKVFTVKWRQKGIWSFTSASAPMPAELLSTSLPSERRHAIAIQTAIKLLSQNLGGSTFSVVVLNIGASSFVESHNGDLNTFQDIRTFLQNLPKSSEQDCKAETKKESKMNMEISQFESDFQSDQPHVDLEAGDAMDEARATEELLMMEMGQSAASTSYLLTSNAETLLRPTNGKERLEIETCGRNEVAEGNLFGRATNFVGSSKESSHSPQEYTDRSKDGEGEFVTGYMDQSIATCSSSPANGYNLPSNIEMMFSSPTQTWEEKTVIGNVDLDSIVFFCEKCHKEMKGDYQARQEHDDYHMALELDSQERQYARRASSVENKSKIGNSSRGNITPARPSPSKKLKGQKHTLDSFVYKL